MGICLALFILYESSPWGCDLSRVSNARWHSFLGAIAIVFSGCGEITTIKQAIQTELSTSAPESDAPSPVSGGSGAEEDSNFFNQQGANGYVFYGEYRPSGYSSGIKVCDYPGFANCRSDADGPAKGRAIWASSGLSPLSKVHRLRFEFQSNGYFSKNPGAHIAFGLRGRITKNAAGIPTAINGRGFLIGNVHGDPRNQDNPACGRRILQIESYFGDEDARKPANYGNDIFPASCTDSIFEDGKPYTVELYVSSSRQIGYKVFDSRNRLIHSYLMVDPTDFLDPNLDEWFVAHVFDTPVASSTGNWNFVVKNIVLSETEQAVGNFFLAPLMSYFIDSYRVPDGSIGRIFEQNIAVGEFAAVRKRVFGCATLASRTACDRPEQFRPMDLATDASFTKAGSRQVFIASPWDAFPKERYKVVLRLNPESSFKQATILIDTR